jgi:hypothetical protein
MTAASTILPLALLCYFTASSGRIGIMPFASSFRPIYDDHIRPTVEKLGLNCKRADDIYGTQPVIEDIWEQICHARVLIAELTGRNANVFYELGIAHTVGKNVILIAQSETDFPFDLLHLRHITHSDTARGAKQLESALEQTLRSVLASQGEPGLLPAPPSI